MQGNVWYSLLQQVPAEYHHKMMVVTTGGTEIAIQSVLRIDQEFMAIKGRLSGSQDSGRVFFMPYQSIDYFGFQLEMKDEEYASLFGNLSTPDPHAVPAAPAAVPAGAPPPAPEPEPEPEPVAAAPVGPSQKTPLPIKSAVLERFRSRNLSGSSSQGATLRPPTEQ
jgi:hypothetical protein